MATNDRDFDCQQCGAHFNSREALDQHKQQHTRQAQSGSSSNVSSSSRKSSSPSNIDNRGMNGSDRDLKS